MIILQPANSDVSPSSSLAANFLQACAQISSQQLYIFRCHPIVSDSNSACAYVVLAYFVTNSSWANLSKECHTCRAVQTNQQADLATEQERQLTTARANETTGLANRRAANWAPEVEFSPFRALSRRQMTFPFCCQISLVMNCQVGSYVDIFITQIRTLQFFY